MKTSLIILCLTIPTFLSIFLNGLLRAYEGPAGVVFTNATIYTGDPNLPWAEAMSVTKGRINVIGSSSYVRSKLGPRTENVDLQGKFVVPGFIDSHVHLLSGGLQMSQLALQDVSSQIDFIEIVKSFLKGVKQGHWVLGGGWNNERWGGELPRASWIDSFTEDIPVWLYRMDGHMGLANSKALRLAGITANTHDPDGGNLMRDVNGELTGILVDSAMKLVIDHIPEATIEERRDALKRASLQALSQGITAVVDFGRFFPGSPTTNVWDDFHDVYRWADQTGNLLLRVSIVFPLVTWLDVLELVKQEGRKLSQNLRIGALKTFADGSLGSGSALFNEPYDDNPTNFGLELLSYEALLEEVLEADNYNLQVAIHAIGDAANDRVLAVYKAVNATNGQRDRRSRIEHAQHLSKKSPELFQSLGVIPSMQPDHLLDDAGYAARKLGEIRALEGSYLIKTLVEKGIVVAFGSDWPVAHLNPLSGIRTAVRRKPHGWQTSWIPSERINVESALKGYTSSAAYAAFMDEDIGSLSPGKFADFVVLSGDIFENNAEVDVISTYKGGIIMFSKP